MIRHCVKKENLFWLGGLSLCLLLNFIHKFESWSVRLYVCILNNRLRILLNGKGNKRVHEHMQSLEMSKVCSIYSQS